MSDYVMNIDFASLYPNVQKRYSITSDLRKRF